MNKSQQKQLEILEYVDQLCRKHHIKYFITAGTLLGAVRHKGFIPWDDDIDIGLPRAEYEKFKEIMKKEKNDKYFFQNLETDPNIGFMYSKMRLNNTKYIEKVSKNANIHHGIYIDIFPIDEYGYQNDSHFKKVVFFRMLLLLKSHFIIEANTFIKKIELVILKILVNFFSKKRLIAILNHLMSTNKMESPYVINYSTTHFNHCLMNKKFFDETIDLEFEGKKFKATKYYDEYLTFLYGSDYMKIPPKEKQVTHDILEIDYGDD